MTLQSGFTFQLWDEMRAHAQRMADGPADLPTLDACRTWLEAAVLSHRAELPPHVLEFYSGELWSMIAELRDARDNPK